LAHGHWLRQRAVQCAEDGYESYLVALQIALDFVFIAILLASFVGQAANSSPNQSSK
jgi:hypothetical protein